MKRHPFSAFVLTDHARLQMKRRGIAGELVRQVMEAPQQSETVRPGRWVHQSRLLFGSPKREYLVRVFIDVDRIPVEVVTVYCTTKIGKYWRA